MSVSLFFGKPLPEKHIWVGVISHKSGENLYAAESEEGLTDQFYEYVRSWWMEDGPGRDDEEMPEDKAAAVERYFEYNDDEWLQSDLVEVHS